jgi:hypothetical protein
MMGLVHVGLHASGAERFATVSSGPSFAQVADPILGKQARVQNPDKDALLPGRWCVFTRSLWSMGWRLGSVDGRGSRPVAGSRPRAGVVAQAASGSRSWCRRRRCTASPQRPPCGGWPGPRRAALRTAPAAPRSAVPGQGRAKSPPTQDIEHEFENPSSVLRIATGTTSADAGRVEPVGAMLPPIPGTQPPRSQRPRPKPRAPTRRRGGQKGGASLKSPPRSACRSRPWARSPLPR